MNAFVKGVATAGLCGVMWADDLMALKHPPKGVGYPHAPEPVPVRFVQQPPAVCASGAVQGLAYYLPAWPVAGGPTASGLPRL